MKIQRLGVDVGGVIIDRINDGTDTSFFSDNYLKTTAVPGAIETIARLAREKFGPENIFLVSKCGRRIEKKSLEWLRHRKFYETTGLTEEQVHFCRARRDKASICSQLGITHFVDDHFEVLEYLAGIVGTLFLLSSDPREISTTRLILPHAKPVLTWEEIYNAI